MEKKQCTICGKVIEGYHESHVDFLMKQHMLTHPYSHDIEEEGIKDNEKTG